MVSARVWGPAALVILASIAWVGSLDVPARSAGNAQSGSKAFASMESTSQSLAVVRAEPRVQPTIPLAPNRVRALAEPPRLLSIAALNPETGFVVERQMLEWLPAGLELQAGDAVLRINGEPMASTAQLLDAVRGASEGSAVELRVRRSTTGEEVSYWAAP